MEKLENNAFYKISYRGSVTIGKHSAGYFDIVGVPEKIRAEKIRLYGIVNMNELYDFQESDIDSHIENLIHSIDSLQTSENVYSRNETSKQLLRSLAEAIGTIYKGNF